MQYIVPTLVVEAIKMKAFDVAATEEARSRRKRGKKDPLVEAQSLKEDASGVINESCNASQCLSKTCRLTERYCISNEDLVEIDRYIYIAHIL